MPTTGTSALKKCDNKQNGPTESTGVKNVARRQRAPVTKNTGQADGKINFFYFSKRHVRQPVSTINKQELHTHGRRTFLQDLVTGTTTETVFVIPRGDAQAFSSSSANAT